MDNIIIKYVREPYEQDKDILRLLCYIAGECDNKKERTRYCCGEGVSLNPEKAAKHMINIQKSHGKAVRKNEKRTNRRIYHYVVSFPLSMDDANFVKLAAVKIAGIFSGEYQVYYGVHEDEDYLHIHYAINAVSTADGKKWHKNRKQLEEMETEIRETVETVFKCYNF